MSVVFADILTVLLEKDPQLKCRAATQLCADDLALTDGDLAPQDVRVPGQPPQPERVPPAQVPQRKLGGPEGRERMLHAFAHIEFNAINLALDAAYRFRQMPQEFVHDWLLVASEEAKHFQLLNAYLSELGTPYGHYPAHNGLWDMVQKTRHDVLHRMALVPRVMEARGLDVTPGMMQRFGQLNDQRAVSILQVIYEDEVGHVAIGNRWYHYCCEQRGVEPRGTFQALIREYFDGRLRGPFNYPARQKAGFAADELAELEQML